MDRRPSAAASSLNVNEIPSIWLPDFDDLEDFKLTEAQEKERFGASVTESDVDKATCIATRVPEKTRRQTAWAISVRLSQLQCSARGEAALICFRGPPPGWSSLPRQDIVQDSHWYTAILA